MLEQEIESGRFKLIREINGQTCFCSNITEKIANLLNIMLYYHMEKKNVFEYQIFNNLIESSQSLYD